MWLKLLRSWCFYMPRYRYKIMVSRLYGPASLHTFALQRITCRQVLTFVSPLQMLTTGVQSSYVHAGMHVILCNANKTELWQP